MSARLDSSSASRRAWTTPSEGVMLSFEMMDRRRSLELPVCLVPTPPASANDVRAPDAYVDRALAAMRAEPARAWTVAALARVAGLSRAPFARRFQRATGTSPLRWLTEHRLGLAKARLIESDLALAPIAAEVGYASEFAFSKAFKRLFGVAPARFRRAVAVHALSRAPLVRAAA